ncbi:hypothetical protein Tco_0535263 [Tanacetum coccineum]
MLLAEFFEEEEEVTCEERVLTMNKKVASMDEEEVPEELESTKVEVKQVEHEENIRKRLEEIDYESSGCMRIMFEETVDDDIWKNQEKWIIKNWTFYENYGVYILALEDGTEIHMLAERRYPLIRETLERMMELRLTAESEGEAIFDLLRFIQKLIDEFEEQDGSEKDL